MHRHFIAAFLLASFLSLPNCATPTDDGLTLESLSITPADPNTTVGGTISFVATGTYNDGSIADLTSSVTWASERSLIATMAGNIATGVNVGFTTIFASELPGYGGVTTTTTLTVTDAVTAIAITPADYDAGVSEEVSYAATATFTSGATSDVTTSVTWASSNLAVATMAANVATTLAAGQTTITATLGSVSGTQTLNVTASVLSITVTPADASVLVSNTVTYTATNELAQDITGSVTWSSSNTAVATMAANVATGLSPGITTITATQGAVSGSTPLIVNALGGKVYAFAGAALGAQSFDHACFDPDASAFTGPVTSFSVSGDIYQIFYMPGPGVVVVHTSAGFDTYRPGAGCSLDPLTANVVPSSAQYGDAAVRPGTGVVAFGNLANDDRVSFFEFSASGTSTALPDLDLAALSASGRVSSIAWLDDGINPPKTAGKFGNGLGDFIAVGTVTTGSGGPFTVVDDAVTAAPETAGWVAAPGGFLVGYGSQARAFRIPSDQPVPIGSAPVTADSPRNWDFNYTSRCGFGFPGLTAGASYQYFKINASQEITDSGGANVLSLAQVYRFNAFPDANRAFAFGRVSGGVLMAIVLDLDLDCRVTQVGTGVALTPVGVPFVGGEQFEAGAVYVRP